MLEERVARLLAADSLAATQELRRIMEKIVGNILRHPDDPSKRRLRVDNKVVNTLLKECAAALSTFQLFGFEQVNEPEGSVLLLRDPYDPNKLLHCNDWLSDQVRFCELLHRERGVSEEEPCAEVIVKIRYHENKRVNAGFSFLDTVNDVLSFAKTLYSAEVQDNVVLREPYGAGNIGHECLPLTLAEKGWGRGVVLVATCRSEPISVALGKSRVEAEATQAEAKEERLKKQLEVQKKRDDDEKARARAIQQFHDDRERKRQMSVLPLAKPRGKATSPHRSPRTLK